MRMMMSFSDEQRAWLEKKSEETGATAAGVVRNLIKKEMVKEKNAKSEDTKSN